MFIGDRNYPWDFPTTMPMPGTTTWPTPVDLSKELVAIREELQQLRKDFQQLKGFK